MEMKGYNDNGITCRAQQPQAQSSLWQSSEQVPEIDVVNLKAQSASRSHHHQSGEQRQLRENGFLEDADEMRDTFLHEELKNTV